MKNITLKENTPPQTNERNKLRDKTLDVAAGILIIRMILGHYMTMCGLNNSTLAGFLNILFFYMPWFFFKSGMYCQMQRKDTKPFLISNMKKFIVPFIVFTLMGTIIGFVSCISTGQPVLHVVKDDIINIARHGSSGWNAPLWFLLSLCVVRVLFNLLNGKIRWYFLLIICLVCASLHNIFLSAHGIFWIGNVCSGMFFYILGKEMKDTQYRRKIFITSLIVLISIGLYRPTIVTMFGNFLLYDKGFYLIWYPFCLAGIIVFNNLIRIGSKFFEHYNFSNIGRYSMIYYVIHYPLGLLICDFYYQYSAESDPNNWEILFYLSLMWFGLLPLLTYLFNTKRLSFCIGR